MNLFHRLLAGASVLTLAAAGLGRPNPGACCSGADHATCTLNTPTSCGFVGGDYQGNNTTCSPISPCALGACCAGLPNPPGTCSVINQYRCAAANVIFQGAGATCTPFLCLGTCCNGATCTFTSPVDCRGPGMVFHGNTSLACNRDVCPGGGAACNSAPRVYLGSAYTYIYTAPPMPPPAAWTCAGTVFNTQYFYFIAPTTGYFTFDTQGSQLADTVLSATFSCGFQDFACDANGGSASYSRVSILLFQGQPINLRIGTVLPFVQGDVRLNIASATLGACCSGATCTMTAAAQCQGAGSVYRGDSVACVLDACTRGSADCFTAPPVTLGSAFDYVSPSTGLPALTSCAQYVSGTRFFRFTAPTTDYFSFDALGGGGLDAQLSMLSTACVGEFFCSNDGTLDLNAQIVARISAGTSVILRVAGAGNGPNGPIELNTRRAAIYGACCDAFSAQCTLHTRASACPPGSVYQGNFTTCTPGICGPAGACTTPSCDCTVRSQLSCAAPSVYRGDGTTCSSIPCQRANDECTGATPIDEQVPYFSHNFSSTHSPISICASTADGNDVWYSFTPAADNFYVIRASPYISTLYAPPLLDLSLELYAGCDQPALACLAAYTPISEAITLNAHLRAGVTYRLRISGAASGRGYFRFDIIPNVELPPPPANDTCATAIPVSQLPFYDTREVISAGPDLPISCDASPSSSLSGVWYSFTAAADGYVRAFSLSGPFSGSSGATAAFTGFCNAGLVQIGCAGAYAPLIVQVSAGQTYHFLLAASSDFPIQEVSHEAAFSLTSYVPLTNDPCGSGPALTVGSTVVGTNVESTADRTVSCVAPGPQGYDVWYNFTAPVTGTYTFDTIGTRAIPTGNLGDSVLALFAANCNDQLACDTYSSGNGHDAFIALTMSAGQLCRIRVAGMGGAIGPFILHVNGSIVNSGACCTGSTCAITEGPDCPGHFAGPSIPCNAPGNTSVPCNLADFNQSGGSPTVQDIFDFLGGYFIFDPRTDINASGAVSVQDIFDFLGAFFSQ